MQGFADASKQQVSGDATPFLTQFTCSILDFTCDVGHRTGGHDLAKMAPWAIWGGLVDLNMPMGQRSFHH